MKNIGSGIINEPWMEILLLAGNNAELGGDGDSTAIPSVFPTPESNMTSIFHDHGALGAKGVQDALVVFHLDGCYFCEVTLGSLMYEMAQPDSVLNKLEIHPFQLLVDHEGNPDPSHTYCTDTPACLQQAQTLMGVSVGNLTSFPAIQFWNPDSNHHDVSDTKCGIAIRGNAPDGCSSTAPEKCAALRNTVSNWACGMHIGQEHPMDQECDTAWWKKYCA